MCWPPAQLFVTHWWLTPAPRYLVASTEHSGWLPWWAWHLLCASYCLHWLSPSALSAPSCEISLAFCIGRSHSNWFLHDDWWQTCCFFRRSWRSFGSAGRSEAWRGDYHFHWWRRMTGLWPSGCSSCCVLFRSKMLTSSEYSYCARPSDLDW